MLNATHRLDSSLGSFRLLKVDDNDQFRVVAHVPAPGADSMAGWLITVRPSPALVAL